MPGALPRGHLSVNGEDLAIPLAEPAGSTQVGDAAFDEILPPMGRRLVARCRGVLRPPGASTGSDEMFGIVRARGAWVAVSKAEIDRQLAAKTAEVA